MTTMTDATMSALCDAMREFGAGIEFELQLGELVGRYRRAHDLNVRDMEIAQLIPHGVDNVCERFGGKRRINQYRAARGRKLLKLVQSIPA